MGKVADADTSSLRKWRVDQGVVNGLPVTIWAWYGRNQGGKACDFMLALYSLPTSGPLSRSVFVAEDMTHEFTAYEIATQTSVDYEKSLFEQSGLSPIVPAMTGYQIECHDDEAAFRRLEEVVFAIVDHVMDFHDDEQWSNRFFDGERVNLDPDAVRTAERAQRRLSAAVGEHRLASF